MGCFDRLTHVSRSAVYFRSSRGRVCFKLISMKLQTYIRQKLPMAVLSFALKAAVAHVWYNIIYEVLLALVLPSMRETVLVSVLDLLLQLLLVQLKEAVARVPYGIISRPCCHAPLNEPLELVLLPTRGNTGGNTGGGSSGGAVAAALDGFRAHDSCSPAAFGVLRLRRRAKPGAVRRSRPTLEDPAARCQRRGRFRTFPGVCLHARRDNGSDDVPRRRGDDHRASPRLGIGQAGLPRRPAYVRKQEAGAKEKNSGRL